LELIRALQNATRPDRELDAQLAFVAGYYKPLLRKLAVIKSVGLRVDRAEVVIGHPEGIGGQMSFHDLPAFTANATHALSLLGDRAWDLRKAPNGTGYEFTVAGSGLKLRGRTEALVVCEMVATLAATETLETVAV
jgi:hypothetical protein